MFCVIFPEIAAVKLPQVKAKKKSFAADFSSGGIIEHDFFTGKDNGHATLPTPDELWHRLQAAENITPEISGFRVVGDKLNRGLWVFQLTKTQRPQRLIYLSLTSTRL